ncbi:MAG: hypothetical protein NTZ14_16545 [Hyphomicrobiales bacterium]|nr:hypothetical protein [Hyphomicrobiales bacterium]
MIAWDGSPPAARAVTDAINLFPGIVFAEIVVVLGETPLDNVLPGAELAHHRARKGPEARIVEAQAGAVNLSDACSTSMPRKLAQI